MWLELQLSGVSTSVAKTPQKCYVPDALSDFFLRRYVTLRCGLPFISGPTHPRTVFQVEKNYFPKTGPVMDPTQEPRFLEMVKLNFDAAAKHTGLGDGMLEVSSTCYRQRTGGHHVIEFRNRLSRLATPC